MVVGVSGVGYLAAATDPRRHWPIVLVGALARGTFPPAFGLTILTNDLIWWVPFAWILWDAAKHGNETSTAAGERNR